MTFPVSAYLLFTSSGKIAATVIYGRRREQTDPRRYRYAKQARKKPARGDNQMGEKELGNRDEDGL